MSEPEGWPYAQAAAPHLPRLFSWEDREPHSVTHGCMDRTFWSWKFTDFPGARFQEGVYALARLHAGVPGLDEHAGRERLAEWAAAGMRWWAGLQHRDGSFDEAYPQEHSLAATAFTGFYVGEAALLMEDVLDADTADVVRRALDGAGRWLCRNDEHHGVLSNHLAAAAAALHSIARCTGEERYVHRADHFLQRIYDHQSDEGWYLEYEGADPGYQTHTTFYLASVWRRTGDDRLAESLSRSLAFLRYFVHPDGSLGGEYASRNTGFYLPAGFEMLADRFPAARAVARFQRAPVARGDTVGLTAVDAYNFLPVLNSYLRAAVHASPDDEDDIQPLPAEGEREVERLFREAGLLVRATPFYYAVLGLHKGGVLKVFDRREGRAELSDCGYWGRLSDGRTVSSQAVRAPEEMEVDGDRVRIVADFSEVVGRTQSPFLFVLFRLFSITVGRLGTVARWLKDLLVRHLVRARSREPIRLDRSVHFVSREVVVRDELRALEAGEPAEMRWGARFSTIHMGSSRYFAPAELAPPRQEEERDLGPALRSEGSATRERVVRFSEGSP